MEDFKLTPSDEDPNVIEFEHVFELEGKADAGTVTELDNGDLLIAGYASVFAGMDRQNENFVPGAFQRGVKSFLDRKTRPLCFHHKRDMVIGEITNLREDPDKGLWMEARVDGQEKTSPLYHVYNGIKKGSISGLSVGGHFARKNVSGRPMIANCDIIEISATGAPVHPDTSFSVIAGKALASSIELPEVPEIEDDVRESDIRQIEYLVEELEASLNRLVTIKAQRKGE